MVVRGVAKRTSRGCEVSVSLRPDPLAEKLYYVLMAAGALFMVAGFIGGPSRGPDAIGPVMGTFMFAVTLALPLSDYWPRRGTMKRIVLKRLGLRPSARVIKK